MRETLFSVSLEQADSLKETSSLAQEMSDLILKALKTDKRSLRGDLEKAIFKAKLEKYCSLYRQTREKYLVIQKRDGKSTTYKEPAPFERVVRDFNWQKTVTYSKPVKRHEEDEDHVGSYLPELIDNDIPIKTKIDLDMSTIFKRTDPEVIESAKTMTELEFVQAFSHTTATEVTLKKAYLELKGSTTSEAIKARVGEEASDDILGTPVPSTEYKVDDKVNFEFAGSNLTGTIIEAGDNKYSVQSPDGTKYPITLEKLRGHAKQKKTTTTTTAKPAAVVTTTTTTVKIEDKGDLPSFKALDKIVKLEMIQKLFDEGNITTAMVKAKLAENYHIGHYDDVYNVFIKIKK